MMMILPITLTFAAAAALLNIWLSIRVGQVRMREKVDVGDGGNEVVLRRMRAHSNYIENIPFALALVLVIELAIGTQIWLWVVAGVFLVARIAHGIGMDGAGKGRMFGTIVNMLTLIGLALVALAIPFLSVTADGSTMADGAIIVDQ